MIRVTIDINGHVIHQFNAVRIAGGTNPDDINTYKTDFSTIINHRYGDMAIPLCIDILKEANKVPIIRHKAEKKLNGQRE